MSVDERVSVVVEAVKDPKPHGRPGKLSERLVDERRFVQRESRVRLSWPVSPCGKKKRNEVKSGVRGVSCLITKLKLNQKKNMNNKSAKHVKLNTMNEYIYIPAANLLV